MSCLKIFCLVAETKRPSQVIQVESCTKSPNKEKWNIAMNKTVVQQDNSSCGVIMCIEAWIVLSDNKVVSSGNVQKDCVRIINEYEKLTHISSLVCFRKNLFVDLSDDVIHDNVCKVCLHDIEEDSDIIHLQCGHKYHPKCLLKWCSLSLQCAVCGAPVSYKETLNMVKKY